MPNRLEDAARRRNARLRELASDAIPKSSGHGACTRCDRTDGVEAEEVSGSSANWFVCSYCGHRWTTAPRR